MKHLRLAAILWLLLGVGGMLNSFDKAANDIEHGGLAMPCCFLVAALAAVGALGLFNGATWARVLMGILMVVVGFCALPTFLFLLSRKHYAYASATAALLLLCGYTFVAVHQDLESNK